MFREVFGEVFGEVFREVIKPPHPAAANPLVGTGTCRWGPPRIMPPQEVGDMIRRRYPRRVPGTRTTRIASIRLSVIPYPAASFRNLLSHRYFFGCVVSLLFVNALRVPFRIRVVEFPSSRKISGKEGVQLRWIHPGGAPNSTRCVSYFRNDLTTPHASSVHGYATPNRKRRNISERGAHPGRDMANQPDPIDSKESHVRYIIGNQAHR